MRGAMERLGLIGYLALALSPAALWIGELALGRPWAGVALLVALAALGWLLTLLPGRAGRFPLRAALCGAAMALAIAGTAVAPLGLHWAYRLAIGLAAALEVLAMVRGAADRGASGHRAMAFGMALFAASGVAMYFVDRPAMNAALLALGAAFLAATGVALNGQSLRTGAARDGARPSAALRAGSRPWLVVMALAVVALAMYDRLREAARAAGLWVMTAIGRVMLWLSSLFATTEQAGPSGGGQQQMMGLPAGEASPLWTVLEKVFYAVAALLALVALAFALRQLYRLLRKAFALISARMRRLYGNIGEAYVDEKVGLYDADDVVRALRDRAARLKRLVTREPRWATLDGRGKVRRLVRDLMRNSGAAPGELASRTVREAAPQLPLGRADAGRLADLYERARYSEEPISDTDAEALRREVNP
ncbi:MAG: DUF4129 domain-containing protein [Clostridiales bacterium]|nr:DUF4129 domain-containing protein [Clostridiales bacterium]